MFTIAACGTDCAPVGCQEGLTVLIPSVPQLPYKIEVFDPVGATLVLLNALECTTQVCGAVVYVSNTTLTRVIVRVTTPLGVRETDFPNLTYSRTYPSGRDCGPLCTSAQLVAPVPE
jgi:hypothetical protein